MPKLLSPSNTLLRWACPVFAHLPTVRVAVEVINALDKALPVILLPK